MKLNRRVLGEGDPLIILHGVFGSSDNWQSIGKDFADLFRVYLVDQRNHGKSPHSDEFNYELMAEDLKELLDDEGLSTAHVLGHSMGGKTAMNFAVKYPDRLKKLIVVDIVPKVYPPHHQKILEGFNSLNLSEIESRNEADEKMGAVIHSSMIRQFLLKNLSRGQSGFEWKINLSAIEENIEKIGEGLDENEIYEGDTLFIGGKNSDYITQDDFNKINHHFPNAKIEMVEGAGHWVHAEKPKALYDLVVDYLS